ncbi:MAG: hypothetical protein H6581_13160 [Bacteroidia bacterium]|nr:hypothetical protein [Bacteroidia bacterium]
MKEFIRGKKYTESEYIELSIAEMHKSQSEHSHKSDPKVGAVLVDRDGAYFDKAHRGEFRAGDHGEYTLLERKHPGEDLTGFTLYTTLEPCVMRKFPKKGCYKRAINARIGKVVIGHEDPDPTVAGDGIKLLENAGVEIGYYDRKYKEIIAKANEDFFREATERAKQVKQEDLQFVIDPIESELTDFNISDLSEEAQKFMIDKMGLPYKLGSDGYHSFLTKMKLIRVNPESKFSKPTGLGLLLLGQMPQIHFPQSRIKFTIRRKGNDTIIKDFEGPLVLLPDKIEEYLEFIFPKGFAPRSEFQRNEKVTPSATALLEVIMNAIVHRDYSIEGAKIMVEIDDDKVTVSSPGIPLCSLNQLNNFSAPSFSRNSKIAYIFFQMGFVEERGFGMEELGKLEKFGFTKPVFSLEGNILKTIISLVGHREESEFSKLDLPGFEILKEKKRLTTREYEDITGYTQRTALRHLKALVLNGLARKDGRDYEFIE